MESAIKTIVTVFLKSSKAKDSLGKKQFQSLVKSQLSNILTDTDSKEAVNNMGAGLDANQDGKVGFEEYLKLVRYVAVSLSEQRTLAKEEPPQNATTEQVAQSAAVKAEVKPEAKEEAKAEASEEAKAEASAEVKVEANAEPKVEVKAEGATEPEVPKEEESPAAAVAAAAVEASATAVEVVVKEEEKVEITEKVEEVAEEVAAATEEAEKKTEEATS